MRAGWAALADWYDRKQGDGGDLWHRALIDPALLQVLGEVRGLDLLDLGCGNGYLSRRFAREGARVTGVDSSAPIIARARARERARPLGIRYRVADAERLSAFAPQSFDVVVSNMALMDIAHADAAIREVGRLLRPAGRLVASLCHPCFDVLSRSTWELEVRPMGSTTVWRKVQRYRELYHEPVPWVLPSGRSRSTEGYHRPLSWYFRALRSAGLAVEQFEEPAPLEEMLRESPQGPYIAQVPLHCVLGARKAGPPPPAARATRRPRGTGGRPGRGRGPH